MLPTLNLFVTAWQWINDLISSLNFDELFIGLYEKFFQNSVPELLKWLLLILLAIIIVLGTISLIKKTFKTFIVLTIIVILIIVVF